MSSLFALTQLTAAKMPRASLIREVVKLWGPMAFEGGRRCACKFNIWQYCLRQAFGDSGGFCKI